MKTYISTCNKLSPATMDSHNLSPSEVDKLLDWMGQYVQNAHLKQDDPRHKSCNFIVVADEKDGEAVVRFEIYHNLKRDEEFIEHSLDALIKVVDELGLSHWDNLEEK